MPACLLACVLVYALCLRVDCLLACFLFFGWSCLCFISLRGGIMISLSTCSLADLNLRPSLMPHSSLLILLACLPIPHACALLACLLVRFPCHLSSFLSFARILMRLPMKAQPSRTGMPAAKLVFSALPCACPCPCLALLLPWLALALCLPCDCHCLLLCDGIMISLRT